MLNKPKKSFLMEKSFQFYKEEKVIKNKILVGLTKNIRPDIKPKKEKI